MYFREEYVGPNSFLLVSADKYLLYADLLGVIDNNSLVILKGHHNI